MYNKKLASILLALMLVISTLSGCGGTTNNDDTSTPITTEQESETNKPSETESEAETEPETESETESAPDTEQGSENVDNSQTTEVPDNNTENVGSTENTENTENNGSNSGNTEDTGNTGSMDTPGITLSQIPAFSGNYSHKLNNGIPFFATSSSTKAYEYYSPLDSLGRCGVAYACLGPELLPTDDRGSISSVKPSGWIQANYSTVPGGALWNRSHLIAWSLAGENANELNLITGTQHMNQIEMQVYEQMVLDYIKETKNHVMYRVTPLYEGNNLVATGVLMEAWSVEDEGESICFNVFLYNVQDGIEINYATGASSQKTSSGDSGNTGDGTDDAKFMINKSNGKIHKSDCGSVSTTKESNRVFFNTWEEAIAYWESGNYSEGKRECGNCHAYSENAN